MWRTNTNTHLVLEFGRQIYKPYPSVNNSLNTIFNIVVVVVVNVSKYYFCRLPPPFSLDVLSIGSSWSLATDDSFLLQTPRRPSLLKPQSPEAGPASGSPRARPFPTPATHFNSVRVPLLRSLEPVVPLFMLRPLPHLSPSAPSCRYPLLRHLPSHPFSLCPSYIGETV